MLLLTTLIVENNHIFAGIYFISMKNVPDQTWKAFKNKFLYLSEKVGKVVIK